MQIKLALIAPNPDQPRKKFSAKELEETAASIRQRGQIQPIRLRPREIGRARFEIVAGERRWRACKLLQARGHWPSGTIEAVVKRMDDRQRDLEAIVENLDRVDISPIEEARAFQRMIEAHGMAPSEIAQELGRKAFRVTDRLQLLRLAPEYVALLESDNLSAESAYEISRLGQHRDQARIIGMINRGQLKGCQAIRAAVMAIVDGLSQADIFAGEPKASERELRTVQSMENKIEAVARMVAAGFDENEVVIARKVAPDRARLMADKLELIARHCRLMETQLRRAAAQGLLVMEGEAA